MNAVLLKFFGVFSLSILLIAGASAQQEHFMYIQAEDQKPFYVKMDQKYLNSSATGYMIIPRLNNNSYMITLGSKKNDWPEQVFTVLVNDDDKGFLLKNSSKINVVLLDLKNEQLLKSVLVEATADSTDYRERDDDFAKTLAKVVSDPLIARIRVEKNEADSTKGQPLVVNGDISNAGINANVSVANEPELAKVNNVASPAAKNEVKVTYLDKVDTNADAVTELTPVTERFSDPVTIVESETVASVKTNPSKSTNDSRFLDMELQNPNAKPDSTNAGDLVITEKKQRITEQNNAAVDTASNKANTTLRMINSDCKSIATQTGFINLRKRMVAAPNEGGMSKIAIKTFTTTCFTTEQIKNLGVLYLSEEERYKFYVAAYPYVSDSHNFGSLEDQLTDNYYQNRFKAMVSR